MSIYTTHTREAILLISTLGLFCAAPSCVDPPEPVPPTPPSGGTAGTGGAPSGGVAPTGGTAGTGGQASECSSPVDDCKAAECRLEALNCRRASDGGPRWETPSGTPLADVCRDREADGDSICPRCIARIATCDEVEACRPHSPGVCP